MRTRKLLSTVALAGFLALAACGGSTAPEAEQSGPAGTGSAVGAAADLGFTVATLDGGTFDGTSLSGRPAVLWFWAPWCPTCVAQARDVTALAATYSGKAAVVGVAGLDTVAAMDEFVTMTKVSSFPHLADVDGVVWKRFEMTAQSTFVVLDAGGKVTARGHLEPEQLRAQLDRLVTTA
jgi:thiol-disulfide isomerase/thioredoxin